MNIGNQVLFKIRVFNWWYFWKFGIASWYGILYLLFVVNNVFQCSCIQNDSKFSCGCLGKPNITGFRLLVVLYDFIFLIACWCFFFPFAMVFFFWKKRKFKKFYWIYLGITPFKRKFEKNVNLGKVNLRGLTVLSSFKFLND